MARLRLTGSGNTANQLPEVLVGDNAQSVLDHGRKSGWWVPTDKEHDLSMNVMTHEFDTAFNGCLPLHGLSRLIGTVLRLRESQSRTSGEALRLLLTGRSHSRSCHQRLRLTLMGERR